MDTLLTIILLAKLIVEINMWFYTERVLNLSGISTDLLATNKWVICVYFFK